MSPACSRQQHAERETVREQNCNYKVSGCIKGQTAECWLMTGLLNCIDVAGKQNERAEHVVCYQHRAAAIEMSRIQRDVIHFIGFKAGINLTPVRLHQSTFLLFLFLKPCYQKITTTNEQAGSYTSIQDSASLLELLEMEVFKKIMLHCFISSENAVNNHLRMLGLLFDFWHLMQSILSHVS